MKWLTLSTTFLKLFRFMVCANIGLVSYALWLNKYIYLPNCSMKWPYSQQNQANWHFVEVIKLLRYIRCLEELWNLIKIVLIAKLIKLIKINGVYLSWNSLLKHLLQIVSLYTYKTSLVYFVSSELLVKKLMKFKSCSTSIRPSTLVFLFIVLCGSWSQITNLYHAPF